MDIRSFTALFACLYLAAGNASASEPRLFLIQSYAPNFWTKGIREGLLSQPKIRALSLKEYYFDSDFWGKKGKIADAKDEALDKYLLESGHDTIERVYTLLDDVKDLDPAIKLRIRKRIVEKFPDFKVAGDEEKAVVSRGLMVTSDKYTEKQKLLSQILDVEVPANQREIAYALSLGDLRENAEYKAAKEKQDELNAKVAKLKNEIERAQIFDRSTASASKIGFGTQTILRNELTGEDELYVILGPWESDPAENVISYLSPLGKKLLNHKAGDKLSFVIHERTFKYVVKSVAVAKI